MSYNFTIESGATVRFPVAGKYCDRDIVATAEEGIQAEILENVSVTLDLADGNQTFVAPEGYLVKSAIIQKPATLIPENIAEGVNIAGVLGTFEGGGGGSAEGFATVTFMNGDEVYYSRPVYIGDDCPDPVTQGRITAPTKENTPQYDYTFSGWSTTNGGSASGTALLNITADRTVYAAYTSAVRKYTITYYDDDGTTVLHTEQVAYGTVPSYTPTKEGVAFDKWTPTPVAVTGDASYTAVWNSVLGSGSCGANLTWALLNTGVFRITGTGNMTNYSSTSAVPWYSNLRTKITSLVIDDGVTSISAHAFANCGALKDITWGRGVTSVGKDAFNYITNATINIPDIDAWASVEFASGSANPFSAYNNNNKAYVNGELLTTLTLSNAVTRIGANTFVGFKTLTSVTIPASVTSVGTGAFGSCENLISVHTTDISAWCEIEFEGISANPLLNAHNLYFNGQLVTDLSIPAGVTKVGAYAFDGCTSLTSIVFPEGVTTIGNYAFQKCSNVASVILPDSLVSTGTFVFINCSKLTEVKIPDGYITINNGMFAGCSALRMVIIPVSVRAINQRAFNSCTALATVNYKGSATDKAGITIGTYNDPLDNATWNYNYTA